MNNTKATNRFSLVVSAVLLLAVGCSGVPHELSEETSHGLSEEAPYQRKLETPAYSGDHPAIIFRIDNVAKGGYEETVEQIIRVFGENNAPVDVAIVPHAGGDDSYDMPFLREYLDAGIIDVSVYGYDDARMEFDTSHSGATYEELKSGLVEAREQFAQYFGVTPIAFTVPDGFFDEDGYRAVQDAVFKIFCTQKAAEPHPSRQPADYFGNEDGNGMCRFPTVSDVARWDAGKQKWGEIFSTDPDNDLFRAVNWGLNNLGVAVVGIHPEAFVDGDNIDAVKLGKLGDIIKASQKLGDVVTFEAWHKYAAGHILPPLYHRWQETPPYSGGPVIIFRLDDVAIGFHEESVKQIIRLFEQNGVPLDVGVVSHAVGRESYHMPFLREYLDAGVIDISVHGYDWTYAQLDTSQSGTTYEELRFELGRAREVYKKHFGVSPVAVTVPTDVFNEDGYRAAQDAGFKLFATHTTYEPHPSTEPVDYFGNKDDNGMYRIPTASDVATWDPEKRQWGDLYPIKTADGLRFWDSAYNYLYYNDMFTEVTLALKNRGMAVIGMHPDAFVDDKGNVDWAKLDQLDDIIKWAKTLGTVTTFEGWYKYAAKPILAPSYVRKRETPAYSGGPAIIFRLDDVALGFHEESVREIMRLFERNNVALDAGVISRASGCQSYDVPLLREYLDAGVIDISVHGYDWTYAQLNTSKSGTTYEGLRSNLVRAREQYEKHFGVSPVAVTVPTDVFNEDGYRAVRDAGFKVFATHITAEPHPSTDPVDYSGNKDDNGMYRIPTASDVAAWDPDKRQWGDIFPIKTADGTSYYTESYNELHPNDLFTQVTSVLGNLGVAAISIHPDAFVDDKGNVDRAKLDQLDDIIKWAKTLGTTTTFKRWYEYAAKRH